MRPVFVTYHPASVFYAGSKGQGGPSRETLERCIREDLARVRSTPAPIRGPVDGEPVGEVFGIDTEYGGLGNSDLWTVAWSDGERVASLDKGEAQCLVGPDRRSGPVPLGYPGTSNTSPPYGGPTYPFTTPSILVGHNPYEDIRHLWEKGFLPKDAKWIDGSAVLDTILVAKMVYEDWPSYKLEDLLAAITTVTGWKHRTRDLDPAEWSAEERVHRCRADAHATYAIARSEWPKILDFGHRALAVFTHRVAFALHRATLSGAIVDLTRFEELRSGAESEWVRLRRLCSLAGPPCGVPDFDPGNDHHLRDLLFTKLGCPVLSVTEKTKEPQVTRAVLEGLAESYPEGTGVRGFLETLVEYGKWEKIHTTYTKGLSPLIYPCGILVGTRTPVGWLPFQFRPLGARTGRRSSGKPNSQNWPKRVRNMIRSRWPGGLILAADYRKLEPRIIAWLSGCQRLLDIFTVGEGYRDVSRALFHREVEEGTELYRGVKEIVLGVHYDMQDDLMAEQLWQKRIRFSGDYGEHLRRTSDIRAAYLNLFPELTAWMEARREEARRTGQVRSAVGRVRHTGTSGTKHTGNQAINSPVQGLASDVTGAALVDVEQAILHEVGLSLADWYDLLLAERRNYLTSGRDYGIMTVGNRVPRMFNEVHDELTFDVPEEQARRITELVVETMRHPTSLYELNPALKELPLDVDPKIGPAWGM